MRAKTTEHVRAACAEAVQKGQSVLLHGTHYSSVRDVRNYVSRESKNHIGFVFKVRDKHGSVCINAYREFGKAVDIELQLRLLKDAAMDGNLVKMGMIYEAIKTIAVPNEDLV